MLGVTMAELLPFIFFFLLYTLFFGVAYSILGIEINTAEPVEEHMPVPTTMQKLSDKPHYPGMERFVSYMLYAFLNSIGDLQIPNYDDWLIQRGQGKITEVQELFAILLVWGIWLVQAMLMVIVMLNYLIAVISQAYERVVNMREIYNYYYKAQINLDYFHIRKEIVSEIVKCFSS